MAIVEKALEKNSDSVELLKKKLLLMSELTPADQFSNDVDALLKKDTGNIILWQSLIMATQFSVALCSVPSVLNLFTRCVFILRQRSRANPRIYDTQILGSQEVNKVIIKNQYFKSLIEFENDIIYSKIE